MLLLRIEDHPRIRGTNSSIKIPFKGLGGSSPHTRDKPLLEIYNMDLSRIIPAYAGQTSAAIFRISASWDHPRIRGTNSATRTVRKGERGSSPHTRDKQIGKIRMDDNFRIIPAYAGQTVSFSRFLL